MLERNRAPTVTEGGFPEGEVLSADDLLRALFGFLRRQYPVILFVLVLVLGLGAVYLFTTPPSFTAQAMMIIDSRKVQLFQQQSVLGDIGVDSATVESQVEILKSDNIARSVIKELRLTQDPMFMSASGGLIGTVLGLIPSAFDSGAPPSESALLSGAVARLESGLSVKRVGLTYVIEINYRSPSADLSAKVANAVADAYIIDQLEAKYQATRRASVWLQDRIRELRGQTSTAERAVVDFKAKNNIVDTGGRLINEQQLAEANSSLSLARAQTTEARARLERIDEIIRAEVPDATVTDTLRNDVITRLRQQYLDLAAREANWAQRYGNHHLAVINLRNQMRELRKSIVDELKRIAQSYKSDYEIAKAREDQAQQGLTEIISQSQLTNQAQIALRELESTAQTYRALHDNFLQRYMESIQQQSFPITEARVITEASPPIRKSHPKSLLVIAISVAGGAILGAGVGMLRDLSDRVFRTSGQIENDLQVDCIAVVPHVKKARTKKGEEVQANDSDSGVRTIVREHELLWSSIDSPFTRFVESLRSIKVAVDLTALTKTNQVIGITSSLPNEGKSTIVGALAGLIAHAGSRTILIDGDLRNPYLSRHLAPGASVGLLELVSGKAALDDTIWVEPSTRLAFLPTVTKGRVPHSIEIFRSDGIKNLFDALRERFDYILVDLSPLSPVADVRVTSKLIDSYIFVVEWGRTKIDVVAQSLNGARVVNEHLLGTVLNKVDLSSFGRYEYNHRDYYYKRYYARYGYTD
jgi:succinoglycan biosynthesis transport protein ExoP